MATFPQGPTRIDKRCNPGERRVLHQLKRCLEDDYIVWHDIPVGPKALQPDFVILSPRWGVLLLEVKDWKRPTLLTANRDRVELDTPLGHVTDANPLRQVRDYTMELVHLMQRDAQLVHPEGPFQGKLLFPYGWGVVFSGIERQAAGDDFSDIFPEHKTLLRDDLDEATEPGAFQQRLWGMFTVSYPHTLTLPQRDRIRWHLFPELRMVPVQASLLAAEPEASCVRDAPSGHTSGTNGTSTLPDLLQVMDLQQEQVARTLGSGHRVIHGPAGSGKTMILICRAQQLAAAATHSKPILILCYNRSLAGRIDAALRQRGVDERVQVRTFHAWCEDMVRSYQIDVPAHRRQDDYYLQLVMAVERSLETGLVPSGQYLALLVDEAHDFEESWLRLCTSLVDPATKSLLVMYDDAQSIYQKKRRKRFTFASVGIEAQGRRTQILKLNYRNTSEILQLAVRCADALLRTDDDEDSDTATVMPASAGRSGPQPVLVRARSPQEEAELLVQRIAALLADGASPDEMAVLCRTRYLMAPIERALATLDVPVESMGAEGFRGFHWQRPSVKLVTLHSAKGLEFAHVFIPGLQALPHKGQNLEDEVRLLYVGMTRATRTLVLSATGRSVLVDRVASALDAA